MDQSEEDTVSIDQSTKFDASVRGKLSVVNTDQNIKFNNPKETALLITIDNKRSAYNTASYTKSTASKELEDVKVSPKFATQSKDNIAKQNDSVKLSNNK